MKIEWRGNEHTNKSSRRGYKPLAIVNHVVAGSGSSCDNWFRSPNNKVSSAHFCVWEDGRITQYVKLEDMAWANGVPLDNIKLSTSDFIRSIQVNPNLYTVSIEHAGHTGKLTPEQLEATVWLHKYIQAEVKRIWGHEIILTRRFILGHYEIDTKRKPNCPGPEFPWDELMRKLGREEDHEMTKEDANKIIRFLSASWFVVQGNKEAEAEFKRLANELRKASGQEEQ